MGVSTAEALIDERSVAGQCHSIAFHLSGENEQHAPQAWQSEAVTSTACVGKTVI
jgi:hypothetical protein